MNTTTTQHQDATAAQDAIDDVTLRTTNAPAPEELAPSSPKLGSDSW
ncbi:hypothetical protein [Agromyces sp. M3QZ16-3]